MNEPSDLRWLWEIYVQDSEQSRRLVSSGRTAQRHEAMHKVSELLAGVEPVEAYAFGQVSRDGYTEPRPLKLNRSGGAIIGWTGM